MTLFNRKCLECGKAFQAKKSWAEFCTTKHRQDFDNRQSSRGGELLAFAMNWRYGESRDGHRKRDMEAQEIFFKLLEAYHIEDEMERKNLPTYRPTKIALAKLGGHRGGLDRLPGVPDGRCRTDD